MKSASLSAQMFLWGWAAKGGAKTKELADPHEKVRIAFEE